VGPTILGYITANVFEGNLRHGGMAMCAVFLIGLFVLPFAPETSGKPLPEEDRGFAH
jgi:hypothetical protein